MEGDEAAGRNGRSGDDLLLKISGNLLLIPLTNVFF